MSCGSITISGAASVTATGGERAAGIGSGKRKATCGNISISGDCTVTAQGGNKAAGIGCGNCSGSDKSVCGAITIEGSGDFNIVTAIRGQGGAHPIGHSSYESDYNTCGTITFGYNTVYTAGGDLYSYSTDGGGLNFEETTTKPDGTDENDHSYDNNTWVLSM